MSERQAIPALPPTTGIADPQVRSYLDALSNAWAVRNGAGREGERFIRASEIGAVASDAVVRVLSGAAAMDVAALQGGDAYQTYSAVVKAVQDLVTKSEVYELLRTPIQLIEPPTSQVDALRARIDAKAAELLSSLDEEVNNRIAAIEAEADLRGSGIYAESVSRQTAVGNLQSQINTIVAAGSSDTGTILAAIQEEQVARTTAISAEAASRNTLAVQMRGSYTGTNSASLTQGLLYSERQARVTAVNAVVSSVSSLTARVGTAEAAIVSEQTARANADAAEASSRNALAVQMRGSYNGTDPALLTQGILFNERQARVTAVNAVVSSVSSLTARVGTAEAAIVSEQTARANADTAITSNVNALTARMGTAEASILSEQTTRVNKDNALAKALNTIWSSIGGSAALIQDSQLAAVSPAAVAATKWTQVQAAVTDPTTGLVNSASIKGELNAYASKVDSTLKTTWAIRSNVNGVISGVSLMTTTGAGSSPGLATSHFMVQADRFSLVHPSNAALKPVPFTVDSSGNAVFTGTVYAAAGTFGGALSAATGTFNGSLIVGSTPALSGSSMSGSGARFYGTSANGSFVLGNSATNLSFNGTTLTLNGNIVSTPNINLGSVSQVLSAEFAGQTSGSTLMSLAISAIAGGRILIMTGFVVLSSSSPSDMTLRVYRNAGNTSVISGSSTLLREVNVGANFGYSAFPPFFDAPGAGTWTYVVQRISSTTPVRARSIVLTEMKR